jgi:hypothetical protein
LRQHRVGRALAAIGALALVLAGLDAAGLWRPRPSFDRLRGRLRQTRAELVEWVAEVGITPERGRSTGSDYSRQWVLRDGSWRLAVKDRYGFVHFQEWLPGEWRYHQAGAGFEARVQLRSLEDRAFARWGLARMPSLTDLCDVLLAGEWQGPLPGGPADVTRVACTPPSPAGPRDVVGRELERFLGCPWEADLDPATGLPRRLVIRHPTTPLTLEVLVLATADVTLPSTWKRVNDTVAQVTSRYTLSADLRDSASVARVRESIDRRAGAFREKQYRPIPLPLPKAPGDGP